jgi:hypothetical protein
MSNEISTYTDSIERCPHCKVQRAKLLYGQWCTTCGYNQCYEDRIQADRRRVAERVAEGVRKSCADYIHEETRCVGLCGRVASLPLTPIIEKALEEK